MTRLTQFFAVAAVLLRHFVSADETITSIPSTLTIASYIGITNLTTVPATPLNVTFRVSYGSSDSQIASLYGNNDFHCPRLDIGTATHWSPYNGQWDLLCDYNGLVRVFTDGEGNFGEGGVRRWYFCEDAPARGKYKYYTVENTASNFTIADSLDCTVSTDGIKTCTQTEPVTFPVQGYALGGTMGYSTMDEEGRWVTGCESRGSGKNPMVLEEDGCVWAAGSVP
ncbi:hypothetical protein HYFRA_00011593 [Hymenoscyphus fraxineus]|uniref:AA1-like domain-containing protein n=1 Tax=Hymenoscyphus fraxineus TaxID=746836 RepID=A0A9N9L438_9HELO|nr:hypothetical protein HYFRA_00011593 [Hymenoscyphus fraxineus]